jgi:hypothetical protein
MITDTVPPGCGGSPLLPLQPRLMPSLREALRLRRFEVLGCPVWAWTGHPAR